MLFISRPTVFHIAARPLGATPGCYLIFTGNFLPSDKAAGTWTSQLKHGLLRLIIVGNLCPLSYKPMACSLKAQECLYIYIITLYYYYFNVSGTRWRSWWRHWTTKRKVAGSIRNEVVGVIQWLNPSVRSVALGSTYPPKEMSTGDISWGCRRPVPRADNLTTFMCRLSTNSGILNFLEP